MAHPERYKSPDELKQQLAMDKKYAERATFDRNTLFAGAPAPHAPDALDKELAKN